MKTKMFLPLRWAKTVILYIILIGCGYLQGFLREPKNNDHHFSTQYHHFEFSEVVFLDEPEERENTFRVQVDVIRLYHKKTSVRVHGKALVYIYKSDSTPLFKAGQHVIIPNTWRAIEGAKNPGSFDFQKYSATNGIYLSAFVQSASIQKLKRQSNSLFHDGSLVIRNQLIKYLPDSSTWAIAQALLIGYRKDIDPELYQAYADTGVMHLIAISGMHIGLLYVSLTHLLSAIPFLRERKKTSTLFTIIALWLFALLCGLQPSILRSAIMFSMIGVGQMIQRRTQLINNLACSAFILLCLYPNWLFDAGFQLSYLAVLSLYFFYKPIYHLNYFESKVTDYVWKLLSATMAAQCLTFPVTLYYFHQFPLSFLFTNIVGIITTTLIIYLEILLLLFSWIPPFALFVGKLISVLIHVTNTTVLWFSHFKGTTLNGLYLYPYQVFLLYAIIGSFAIFLILRLKFHLTASLIFLFFFISSTVWIRWGALLQQKFVFYDIKGKTVFAFMKGQDMKLCPDSLSRSPKYNRYVFQPACQFFHVNSDQDKIVSRHSEPAFDLYQCQNWTVMRIKTWSFQSLNPLKADIIILPESVSEANLPWLTKNISLNSTLIFHPKYLSKKTDKLFEKLAQLGFKVHNTPLKGAFIREFG